MIVAQRRHRKNAGEVYGRIEKQTHNRHANDGQKDTARHLQLLQADNHSQTNQRHHHREAVEVAQRHRQPFNRVFHHQANAVGGDQQQEQADTDPSAMRHALRQVAQDPATNAGGGDHGKQDAHQEHCAKGDRDANLLAQHQAEGGKGGQ